MMKQAFYVLGEWREEKRVWDIITGDIGSEKTTLKSFMIDLVK